MNYAIVGARDSGTCGRYGYRAFAARADRRVARKRNPVAGPEIAAGFGKILCQCLK